MDVRTAVVADSAGGEGPLWDKRTGKLFWLDIARQQINIYNPEFETNEAMPLPERISCIVPYGKQDFAAATTHGISHLYLEQGEWKTRPLVTVREEDEIVSNDGRCDSKGRFVLGMMHEAFVPGTGSLHCCQSDGSSVCILKNMILPNGVAWSANEEYLYAIESLDKVLYRFDYNTETGEIGPAVALMDLPAGDGMCADEKGNLWITLSGLSKVVCVNPKTQLIEDEILFPVETISSCVFGGENMDTLFVTSATWGNPEIKAKFPLAGSLFRVDHMPVKGVVANPFR